MQLCRHWLEAASMNERAVHSPTPYVPLDYILDIPEGHTMQVRIIF